ncbi:O-antigen polysaccharide polymerase Wzy [Williamsia sp. R60]
MLILVAIFGIRPLLVVGESNHLFYGRDVSEGYWTSVVVGALAISALGVGYWLWPSRRSSNDSFQEHPPAYLGGAKLSSGHGMMSAVSCVSIGALATVCIGLVLAWTLLMVALGGGGTGVLSTMAGGRSGESSLAIENLPIIVYSLPAAAAYTAAFWRIVVERSIGSLDRSSKLVFWGIVLLSLGPPALLGNRRFILPCVIAAVIAANFPAKRWNARITPLKVFASLAVVTILASIPYVRSAGSRQSGDNLIDALVSYVQAEGFTGVFTNFFRSYDTEMFDYIALVSPGLGSTIPYGWGRGTFVDVAVSALPAQAVDTPAWSNQILIDTFGQTCAAGVCPVPSYAGTAFFDFGFVGVALLSIICGVLFRAFENSFHRSGGVALLALLIAGSFPATAIRGNYPSQMWIAFNIFVLTAMSLIILRILAKPDTAGVRHVRGRKTPVGTLSDTRLPK